MENCIALFLAAGEGKRMQSSLPKVLHKLAGLSLLGHLLYLSKEVGINHNAVIVGHGADLVLEEINKLGFRADIYQQSQRLGTAHAVLSAIEFLEKFKDKTALILFGDTPLLTADDLHTIAQPLNTENADIVVAGFYSEQPKGYGRLIIEAGELNSIVEEKDASDEQRKIKFCNAGLLGIKVEHLINLLPKITPSAYSGEYYLTDIVGLGKHNGLKLQAVELPAQHVLGVNDYNQLAQVEEIWQQRKRHSLISNGVKMVAPQTIQLSFDTKIAAGAEIEPYSIFGPGVQIGKDTLIKAFSYIEGAIIGAGSAIGPYARIRPHTVLENNTKIGNFCEIKASHIGAGSKVNHLSYIGDSQIGQVVNIGAGVITCNYDGYNKYKTLIADHAFVGSQVALIAPVAVERGAYIATGSIITENVPADSLAIARAYQVNKLNGGYKLRKRLSGK